MAVSVGILLEDFDLLGILEKLKPLLTDPLTRGDTPDDTKVLNLLEHWVYLDFGAGGVSHALQNIDGQVLVDGGRDGTRKKAVIEYTVDKTKLPNGVNILNNKPSSIYEIWVKGDLSNTAPKDEAIEASRTRWRWDGVYYGWNFTESGSIPADIYLGFMASGNNAYYELSKYIDDKSIRFSNPPKLIYENSLYATVELAEMPQADASIAFPCDIYAINRLNGKTYKGSVYLQSPYEPPIYIQGGIVMPASQVDVFRPYWDVADKTGSAIDIPFLSNPVKEIGQSDLPPMVKQVWDADSRS